MRKTASLLAFVIFSILNGIAQTNPYDLVGDTILFYNQATSLLDNRKKQESEVNSFNQLLSKYDVSLIDSARMALSKHSFWFNINMLGDYDREKLPTQKVTIFRFFAKIVVPLPARRRNEYR